MWLVVVEAITKWVEIIPVKEANSAQIIQALNTIFARFGWPIQIWSDNGTTFTSEEFRGFCESKRIRQIFSAPFHPRSNGEAERMMRTFKSMLKKVNPAKSEVMSAVSDMLQLKESIDAQESATQPRGSADAQESAPSRANIRL